MRGTHVVREKVVVDGHRMTIFKRGAESAHWEVDFWKYGKRFHRSLDTPLKKVAEERLKSLIRLIKQHRWEQVDSLKLRSEQPKIEYPSIGKILNAFEPWAATQGLGDKSVKGYISSLRIILREGMNIPKATPAELDRLKVERLSADLIDAYMAKVRSTAGHTDEDDPEETQDEKLVRAMRTANSYMGQARSIFANRARDYYTRRLGLHLPPCITGFLEVPGFDRVAKSEYNPPDDAVIRATFAALEDLKESDLPAYLAIVLACGTGLRKGEVSRAKWRWFRVSEGAPRLSSREIAKNGDFIDLPVLQEWWERLEPLRTDPDEYILPGRKHEREEEVFRRIGPWMRNLGWRTQKTFHEFRAYVGCQVAMAQGLETASLFLRHHSTAFTKKYYGRYIKLVGLDVKKFGVSKVTESPAKQPDSPEEELPNPDGVTRAEGNGV